MSNNINLQQSLTTVLGLLEEFALESEFLVKMTSIFGTKTNLITETGFISALNTLPEVEILTSEEFNGTLGAFSSQTGKIYLSEGIFTDQGLFISVLLEEIGHYVDNYYGGEDTAGDEGELFSNVVRGVNLSESELTRIQTENDYAVINLGGELLEVEQNDPFVLTVTTTLDQSDGSATNGLSLREAIGIANVNTTNDYIIELQGGVTYNLTRSTLDNTNDTQSLYDLDIIGGANVTIKSVGTGKAIINGAAISDLSKDSQRIFEVFQNGELTLNNVTLTEGYGGTIRVKNGGLLHLNNSLISNGSTNFYSEASALENYGTTIINNSEIKNNQSSTAGDSGAIYNTGTLEINSSIISNNSTGSSGDGGGINNYGGTVYLIDSSVSNNTADSRGGGIDNYNGSFKIINSLIENNISGFSGGAIYNSGSFGNNTTLDLINSVVQGNRNNTDLGSSSSSGAIDNQSTMNISQGSQIINNIGNGIYNQYQININDSLISGNAIAGLLSFRASGATQTLQTNLNNVTVENNVEDGVVNIGLFSLNIADSEIINNGSTGIYNSAGGVATVIGSLIKNNDGNGIYNKYDFSDSTISIFQSTIDGNTGHGIKNEESTVYLADSTIQNHHVTGDGGGIYNEEGDITLDSSIIQNNSATGEGGGIYSYDPIPVRMSVVIRDNIIKNNTAQNGGGLYYRGNGLIITTTSISDNQASNAGGGLYVFYGASNLQEVIENSTISNNQATVGGGIFNDGYIFSNQVNNQTQYIDARSDLSLINSTVSSNTSGSSGGGIYNGPLGDIYLYNSTLTNNTSDLDNDGNGSGGAIYNEEGGGVKGSAMGYVETSNSIIAGNFDSPNNAGTGNIHPDISGGYSVGNNNNLIGSLAGTIGTIGTGTDIVNNNPLLGPLQNNGGQLSTHTLLAGSPAINGGNNTLIPADTFDLDQDGDTTEPLPLDQRGSIRIVGENVDIGAVEVTEVTNQNPNADTLLNTPINRFQNSQRLGTYLFATEGESINIRLNYPNFIEEGRAFAVSSQADDNLIKFNRFQNSLVPGTYLYATEGESINIRRDYANFIEEGTAFYAYGAGSGKGIEYYRMQNTQQAGTYIFVNEAEKDQIVASFPQFSLEGIAFEVGA